MRCLLPTSLLMTSLVAVPVFAAEPVRLQQPPVARVQTTPPKHTVRLSSVVLEELETSNPTHHAKAVEIMAAASEGCRVGEPRVIPAEVAPFNCNTSFFMTSYPPKKSISFQIDDTLYLAHVTMKESLTQFIPANPPDGAVAPRLAVPANGKPDPTPAPQAAPAN